MVACPECIPGFSIYIYIPGICKRAVVSKYYIEQLEDTGRCQRQRPVPLQFNPLPRAAKFPFVICNEEREVEEKWPWGRGESKTLSLRPR